MASAGIDFNSLTPPAGEVQELGQLIWQETLANQRLDEVFTLVTGIKPFQKVGFMGDFAPVGLPRIGCTPTYEDDLITSGEKDWEMNPWVVAEQICYQDIIVSFVKRYMDEGTGAADLTSTRYMAEVVYPKLLKAIGDMLFRIGMFGDSAADTVANGGVISNTVNPALFQVSDGLWKRCVAAVGSGDAKYTTIAANTQATYALQMSAIRGAGVATGIIDDMILNAPIDLRSSESGQIVITQSIADALEYDIRENNKGSNLQWQAIFAGVKATEYNGVRLVVVPQMDKMIRAFEDNGTSWNNPHRAIYSAKSNLLLGLGSREQPERIDIWFDKTAQMNYILASDLIGTVIVDETQLSVAY